MTKLYRQGVGAVITNSKGLVFVAKRITPANAWQMPQGGIDGQESPEIALLRELQEEIGTNNIALLHKTPLLTYNLPQELQPLFWNGKYVGQQQYWFFAQFLGNDSNINLNAYYPAEFNKWKWVPYTQLLDIAAPFKLDLYKTLITLGKEYGIFH